MDYDIGSQKSVESDLVDWVEVVRGHLTEVDDFYKQYQAHTYQTSKYKYICRINCDEKEIHKMNVEYRKCKAIDCVVKYKVFKCDLTKKFVGLQKNDHEHDQGVDDVDEDNSRKDGLCKEYKKVVSSLMQTIKFAKQIRAYINTNKKVLFPDQPDIDTPPLSKIQSYVYYMRYKQKPISNKVSDLLDFVNKHKYEAGISDRQPFVFGDTNKIGTGSPSDHFGLGMTSLKLLSYVDAANQGNVAIYHIDGTYKLTHNNFILIVFGRTDLRRQFHPIAFWLTSHEETDDYVLFYKSLLQLCFSLNITFKPLYIMQDAAAAESEAAFWNRG